jgi:hypothetical protein
MTDLSAQVKARIALPMAEIEAFCRKWHIVEFALFGSVLRDDFRPDSDIDVLVTFAPDAGRTLADFIDMKEDVETLFGRPVDFMTRSSIERSQNYLRRREILGTAKLIYAAG